MQQIHVDGQDFQGADAAGTYGELLAVLDPAMAGRARIVTAIRINGVEEPAFREELARARTLAAADIVEVETRTVQELAREALADAVRLMPAMSGAASQLGAQLGHPVAPVGAAALAELAEGLTLLVTLVQAAETWADAGQLARGPWLGDHVVEVARCIDAVNEAQRDEDWVSVADTLTYDLAPALEQWRATLADALLQCDGPAAVAATPAGAGRDGDAPRG